MRYLMLLLILVSSIGHSDELQEADEQVVTQYLLTKTSTLSVSEYEKARSFLYGSASSNSGNDLAMLYTLEGFNGGNNYFYFLAVFKRIDGQLIFQTEKVVGGAGSRSLEFDNFQNGLITLNTQFSLPSDPMCCPSGAGKATFWVYGSELEELNVSPKKSP